MESGKEVGGSLALLFQHRGLCCSGPSGKVFFKVNWAPNGFLDLCVCYFQ